VRTRLKKGGRIKPQTRGEQTGLKESPWRGYYAQGRQWCGRLWGDPRGKARGRKDQKVLPPEGGVGLIARLRGSRRSGPGSALEGEQEQGTNGSGGNRLSCWFLSVGDGVKGTLYMELRGKGGWGSSGKIAAGMKFKGG